MKIKQLLAFLGGVMALACAVPALAQKSDSAWYLGANFGKSSFSTFCDAAGPTCEDSDQSYKLFGGYQVNKYIAVEGGYQYLGTGTDPQNPAGPKDFRAKNIEFVAIAALPLIWDLSIYAKGGFYHARVTGSDSNGTSFNEKNYDVTYGAGIQWDYFDPLAIRAEVQRYPRLAGGSAGFQMDAYVWTIGALWRFK